MRERCLGGETVLVEVGVLRVAPREGYELRPSAWRTAPGTARAVDRGATRVLRGRARRARVDGADLLRAEEAGIRARRDVVERAVVVTGARRARSVVGTARRAFVEARVVRRVAPTTVEALPAEGVDRAVAVRR